MVSFNILGNNVCSHFFIRVAWGWTAMTMEVYAVVHCLNGIKNKSKNKPNQWDNATHRGCWKLFRNSRKISNGLQTWWNQVLSTLKAVLCQNINLSYTATALGPRLCQSQPGNPQTFNLRQPDAQSSSLIAPFQFSHVPHLARPKVFPTLIENTFSYCDPKTLLDCQTHPRPITLPTESLFFFISNQILKAKDVIARGEITTNMSYKAPADQPLF